MSKRFVANTWRLQLALCLVVLSITGCAKETSSESEPRARDEQPPEVVETPQQTARTKMEAGDYESAAAIAQKLLITDPSDETLLLAATIESKRDQSRRVVELLAEIDLTQSAFASEVAPILIQHSMRTGNVAITEATLRTMSERQSRQPRWRHQLWQLLNHQGRRQEASVQADALCRMDQARLEHLVSLIRRNELFPVPIGSEPPKAISSWPPLRRAKWFTAAERYAEALAALDSDASPSPASQALKLRLFAEQQETVAFVELHRTLDEAVKKHADYWCGAGRYLIDRGDFREACGALLRAVKIDPTMRIAFQRLHQCFNALDRSEDAKQFRYRGVAIAETETVGRRVIENPDDDRIKNDLAAMLLPLGRPLEALAWTGTMIPASDVRRQQLLAQKRRDVLSLPDSSTVAFDNALLGVALNDFPVGVFVKASEDARAPNSRAPNVPVEPPLLVNVASEVGADFQWYHDENIQLEPIALYESVGGGIAALDYDLDGWPDLYFAQAACEPTGTPAKRSSELRRNLAGRYVEVTELAAATDFHYSSGIAAGDINQDGFPDLFLAAFGKNRLLINNGDGTFRDGSVSIGESRPNVTTSVAIADLNGDSLPDLFEVNYVETEGGYAEPKPKPEGGYELPSPLFFLSQPDRYFLADGQGNFSPHLITAEIAEPATGLGVLVGDFDGRSGNEIFVGNDLRENHFFQFREEGPVNSAAVRGIANGYSGLANGCMGIATGDFDRDGLLDMHVSNYRGESDNLFLQREGGTFRDVAVAQGLRDVSLDAVAFGSKAVDFDRNGWLDLAVTNGHIFDMRFMNQGYKMKPSMMMSDGNGFGAVEVEDPSGYWTQSYLGRAMLTTDYNRDGRTDLVIGHLEAPAALLENRTQTTGTSIQVELVGTQSERDAIGAKVTVFRGDRSVSQWVTAGDGYFCTDENYLDLVIPDSDSFDSIEVRWPSGSVTKLGGGASDLRYLIVEGFDELIQRQPFNEDSIE